MLIASSRGMARARARMRAGANALGRRARGLPVLGGSSGHEPGDGLAVAGDHHFLALFHAVEQRAESGFRVEGADLMHGRVRLG